MESIYQKEVENMIRVEKHISEIRPSDTILCGDGKIRTVCQKDIKKGGFMGTSVFGDSWRSGSEKVVCFYNKREVTK